MFQRLLAWFNKLMTPYADAAPTPVEAPKPAAKAPVVFKPIVVPSTPAPGFKKALAEVLVYEGGKDDDKYDPGGRTAYGIIQRVYDQWRKKNGLSQRDVWLITPDEREVIYYERYWKPLGCDNYHPSIAFALFNFGVNAGLRQATKDAQRVVGLYDDGIMGPRTRGALSTFDPLKFAEGYHSRQRIFYPKLGHFGRFGKGWMRRADYAAKFAKSLI